MVAVVVKFTLESGEVRRRIAWIPVVAINGSVAQFGRGLSAVVHSPVGSQALCSGGSTAVVTAAELNRRWIAVVKVRFATAVAQPKNTSKVRSSAAPAVVIAPAVADVRVAKRA